MAASALRNDRTGACSADAVADVMLEGVSASPGWYSSLSPRAASDAAALASRVGSSTLRPMAVPSNSHPRLAEVLVCPWCRGDVRLTTDKVECLAGQHTFE